MKVLSTNENAGIACEKIAIGECFTSLRKSNDDIGIYMRVDASSGLTPSIIWNQQILAVNLQSGQLRKFSGTHLVIPVQAEVKF